MTILLLFAFLSGLVTIAAPCIWPILPIVLSSAATGGKRRPLGVTLGIIISFSILTLSIAYIVRIIPFDTEWLRYISVAIITLLGLSLIIPKLGAFIETAVSRLGNTFQPKRTDQNDRGFHGGFLTGLSLGVVWTPCAGPILATIATLAATRAVSFDLILVMTAYMVGVAIPLFTFSIFGQRLFSKSRIFSKYTGSLQKIFGVIMIATALLILTGYDRIFQTKLLNAVPSYSQFLTKLESNSIVTQQLDTLAGRKTVNDQPIPSMQFPKASDANLPKLGSAPDFVGIEQWLNSEALTMDDLKGKVVLVDFWTYTCINCIRTLPYVTGWYEKYKDDNFVVIGVHTPEFEFEKKTANVEGAIKQYNINYPVAQDNDFKTWRAFENRFWPAKYLIDAEGTIRYTHFGEGDYDITEKNIQKLLKEAGLNNNKQAKADDLEGLLDIPHTSSSGGQTPETYLGISRMTGLASPERATSGSNRYSLPKSLPVNNFAFVGKWNLSSESAKVEETGSGLLINFIAKDVYLVITPKTLKDKIAVFINDEIVTENAGKDVENGYVTIDEPRLYHLVSFNEKKEALLQLNFQTPGTEVFAFTFGG